MGRNLIGLDLDHGLDLETLAQSDQCLEIVDLKLIL